MATRYVWLPGMVRGFKSSTVLTCLQIYKAFRGFRIGESGPVWFGAFLLSSESYGAARMG